MRNERCFRVKDHYLLERVGRRGMSASGTPSTATVAISKLQVPRDWTPVWVLEACPGSRVNGGNMKWLWHGKAVLVFKLAHALITQIKASGSGEAPCSHQGRCPQSSAPLPEPSPGHRAISIQRILLSANTCISFYSHFRAVQRIVMSANMSKPPLSILSEEYVYKIKSIPPPGTTLPAA